jgi:2-dehydro-3-deoxyglucarate aldolase/4-hydroxy-2-oxoheptanedioate aldolase
MSFRQKLAEKTPLIGTLITVGCAELSELLAQIGYDWLFVDMEHGSLDPAAMVRTLQSAQAHCHCLVRIPECSAAWFKKALDAGSDGIIVPLVNSPEEARRSVEFAKYPPLGSRSVGVGRAHDYGLKFKQYVDSANDSVALIIQIEHIRAVENLDEILSTQGIDGVFIGPYDLSASMGLMGQVEHPRVQEAVSLVRRSCQQKGIPVGAFSMTSEGAIEHLRSGCGFVAVGTDLYFLSQAAKEALETIRRDPGAGQ